MDWETLSCPHRVWRAGGRSGDFWDRSACPESSLTNSVPSNTCFPEWKVVHHSNWGTLPNV